MARRKTTLSLVYSQGNPSIQQSEKRKPRHPRQAPRRLRVPKPKFTLGEAFSPFLVTEEEGELDVRGIRAVSFLLHSLSDIGNEDVEGFVAHGLGYVLEHYADRLGRRAGRDKVGPR